MPLIKSLLTIAPALLLALASTQNEARADKSFGGMRFNCRKVSRHYTPVAYQVPFLQNDCIANNQQTSGNVAQFDLTTNSADLRNEAEDFDYKVMLEYTCIYPDYQNRRRNIIHQRSYQLSGLESDIYATQRLTDRSRLSYLAYYAGIREDAAASVEECLNIQNPMVTDDEMAHIYDVVFKPFEDYILSHSNDPVILKKLSKTPGVNSGLMPDAYYNLKDIQSELKKDSQSELNSGADQHNNSQARPESEPVAPNSETAQCGYWCGSSGTVQYNNGWVNSGSNLHINQWYNSGGDQRGNGWYNSGSEQYNNSNGWSWPNPGQQGVSYPETEQHYNWLRNWYTKIWSWL